MSFIPVRKYFDDPLAGCQEIMHYEGPGTTMLGSMLLRLRIFLKEEVCNRIGDQLVDEALAIGVNRFEYAINEVLYEIRRCGTDYDESYETVLLNSWTKDMLKRYPEDTVWSFFKAVKINRQRRKR